MERRETGRLLCEILSGRDMPKARLATLSPSDGASLVDFACVSNVGGLFYREVKSRRFLAECIPDDARNRLREAYRNVATTNTSLFLDASIALKALAGNGVPVIALKGLSVAKSIYGDIALRPMSDMDLLVKEEDLVRAGRILLTLGYKQSVPAWESMLKTVEHLPHFTNKNGATIEVHWSIVTPNSPIEVDHDGLWARACRIAVEDVEVLALSPEDLFLHLCIHACHHLETGLGLMPLCDLAGVLRTSAGRIDWRIVMERTACWGGRKCVYLMLRLVQELLGAAPPDEIISAMTPDDYQPVFLDEALKQVFDADVRPSGQLLATRIGQLARIGQARGIKGKVLALLERAFPSREHLARLYPVSVSSPKIYLCYLLRLGRLIGYYTIVLLRLLRRNQSVTRAVNQERRMRAVSDWMFS